MFGKATLMDQGAEQAEKAADAVVASLEAMADHPVVEEAVEKTRSNWKVILAILITLGLVAALAKKMRSDES